MSGIDEQEKEEETVAFYGIITLPGAYSVALSLLAAEEEEKDRKRRV